MKTLQQEVRIAYAKLQEAQEAFDKRTGRSPELGRKVTEARLRYEKLKEELEY